MSQGSPGAAGAPRSSHWRPAAPAADRSGGSGPRPSRSTASMSSTRMTRCGTPTLANAIQRSPGPSPARTPRRTVGRASSKSGQPDLGLVARVRAAGLDHAGIGEQSEVARRGELEVDRRGGCCRAPRCRTWPPGTRRSSRRPSGRRPAASGVRMTRPSAPTPVRRSQSCANTRSRPLGRRAWPGRRGGRSRCPTRSSCRTTVPLTAGPPATAAGATRPSRSPPARSACSSCSGPRPDR